MLAPQEGAIDSCVGKRTKCRYLVCLPKLARRMWTTAEKLVLPWFVPFAGADNRRLLQPKSHTRESAHLT